MQADWRKKETAPPASWPEKGAVKAIDLALRYREGLDLVLKGINVDIKAGEKVCVAPLISGSVLKLPCTSKSKHRPAQSSLTFSTFVILNVMVCQCHICSFLACKV